MNLGEYLAKIILEADDQSEPIIALYPSDSKPPHKGHVEVVQKLLTGSDQVVILLSAKTKDGVTADEAVAVWNLYKDKGLFDGTVEIKISSISPPEEVFDVIKKNPDTDFRVALGRVGRDYISITRYPNVKLFSADVVKESDSTNLRMALAQKNEEEIAKYLPDGVSVEEFLQALNTKPEEKPEEIPAEQPSTEPTPEQPLQESPPINFEQDTYQDYILANRRKIEQAAAKFNVPIDDMEFTFNGGTEVVLNDDMWKDMENTKSYNMKSLEDAISHALKTGINPKPYIDHIKQKKDIPLPLVLQYSQGKYYLVGGEVILSIYRSLGVIPTVLLATLNLQTKTLPEPIHEAHEKVINDEIKELYLAAKELDIPKKELIQAFEKGKMITLTDNIWSKIENTDSWGIKSKEDAIKFAKKYGKNWKPTLDAVKSRKKINPPLVLQYSKGKYYLVGGNTRLMFSKALGVTPKVLMATLPEPLNEGIDDGNNKKLLKEFIGFAIKELGIQKLPSGLTLSYNNDMAKANHTFGTFNPNNDKIWLYVRNRNMADILRTLAHELVHRKQAEDGRLDPNSGQTGSDIENEANAQAGILLRKFGKINNNIYESKKKFGNYLFGDKESGVKIGWYDNEKEEDTPAESELFNYLKKYADSEAETYSNISLDTFIPTFKQIKKQYPEIGEPKVLGYIYRGTAIPEEKLRELEAGSKTEPYNQGEIILNQTYSSRRKVSSWSTEYFPAAGFAVTTAERKGGIPVIMRAKAGDAELFFNPKFMEKLSTQLEDETFNITNPIPVDIMVIKNYKDEFEDIESSYLHNK